MNLLLQVCANSEAGVSFDPAVTFWSYLLARTALGVLTAASLMMFEGAVMATIQVTNDSQIYIYKVHHIPLNGRNMLKI